MSATPADAFDAIVVADEQPEFNPVVQKVLTCDQRGVAVTVQQSCVRTDTCEAGVLYEFLQAGSDSHQVRRELHLADEQSSKHLPVCVGVKLEHE